MEDISYCLIVAMLLGFIFYSGAQDMETWRVRSGMLCSEGIVGPVPYVEWLDIETIFARPGHGRCQRLRVNSEHLIIQSQWGNWHGHFSINRICNFADTSQTAACRCMRRNCAVLTRMTVTFYWQEIDDYPDDEDHWPDTDGTWDLLPDEDETTTATPTPTTTPHIYQTTSPTLTTIKGDTETKSTVLGADPAKEVTTETAKSIITEPAAAPTKDFISGPTESVLASTETNKGINGVFLGALLGIISVIIIAIVTIILILWYRRRKSKYPGDLGEEFSGISSTPVKFTNPYIESQPSFHSTGPEYAQIADRRNTAPTNEYAEINEDMKTAPKLPLPSIPTKNRESPYHNPIQSEDSVQSGLYSSIKCDTGEQSIYHNPVMPKDSTASDETMYASIKSKPSEKDTGKGKYMDDTNDADSVIYHEAQAFPSKIQLKKTLSDNTEIVENELYKSPEDDDSQALHPKRPVEKTLSDNTEIVENEIYKSSDDKKKTVLRAVSDGDNTLLVENELYDVTSE